MVQETEVTTVTTRSAGSRTGTASLRPALSPTVVTGSVINRSKSQKGDRRRYTRGLRDPQVISRGMTRASQRLVSAVSEGMKTYLDKRDKSARRKRDGALRDFGLNVASGLGTTMREASSVPRELVRSFQTRGTTRNVRRALDRAARFNRRVLGMR